MHDADFLSEALIFLIAAVIVAPVFQRLRSSLVLGYLAAGVIIGPDVLGLVASSYTVQSIAELGVVFLLFSVGLELSVERLRVIRNLIFGLGTAQVALTAAAIAAIAVAVGYPIHSGVVIGAGLALSSTAVVLQLLSERGQLTSRRGRLAFAILLLQDLAVVPLLALVAAMADNGGGTFGSILLPLGKAVLALAVVVLVGRLVLRPLLRVIAVGRSTELFAAVTLAVLLGMSWLTASVGLSLAIGGFLAGLLLAETEFRHQVAADTRPFGDLLLGLFFMTVGIGLSLDVIGNHVLLVLGLVAVLFALKAAIIFGLCRCSGVPAGIGANTAFLLGGAGEFGFVIFAMAGELGILSRNDTTILAAVIVVSMILTPLALAIGSRLHDYFDTLPADDHEQMRAETTDLANHVVIAGFGRVGQSLMKALTTADIPYVALEFEPTRVARARAMGLSVYYGDASRLEVLEAVGISRARAAVIILDNAAGAERVVHQLRARYPGLEIYARARDNPHMHRLHEAGASGIVHETYELSLQLGEAVLRGYGADEGQIRRIIDMHRADDYALLADVIMPSDDSSADGVSGGRAGSG